MYYIINENNQIIAADSHFLKACNTTDITSLNRDIILEKITLNLDQEKKYPNKMLTIQNDQNKEMFSIQVVRLSAIIGSLSLVVLAPLQTQNTTTDIDNEEIAIENLILNTKDTHTTHIIHNIEKEIFPKKLSPLLDNSISINIDDISRKIGISKDDFKDFFNEYISTALSLEKDLQNHNKETQSHAIDTLLHLGDALQLEFLQESINKIKNAPSDKCSAEVAAFYETLSRISIDHHHHETIPVKFSTNNENQAITQDINPPEDTLSPTPEQSNTTSDKFELDLDIIPVSKKRSSSDKITQKEKYTLDLDIPILKAEEEIFDTEEVHINDSSPYSTSNTPPKNNSSSNIELSTVKPIHFDFSLQAAADELSLPDTLIKEFMLDFITQAHSETEKMLVAYQEGDLESIQKIGHLLKGVSSNLRINTLSDTLYKIQFCKDLTQIEALIKNFWGHFISFETQMNLLSK